MRIATTLMAGLFTILILLATDATAEDEVYRWVDENGVVHYGDQAAGHSDAKQVDIQNSPPSGSQASPDPESAATSQPQEPSYAQQRRDERAAKRSEAAEKQKAITAGCQQRHQLVARLEPSTRVMVEDENGTVSRMNDNDRLEMLAEAKVYIAEKCNN